MENNLFSKQETAAALMRVLNTATPMERTQALLEDYEVVLTDQAFALLSDNLQKAKQAGDGEAVEMFSSVLHLLSLCREQGVAAGLAELAQQEKPYIASRLQPFIASESWAEKKRLLESHPKALLSETARQMLEDLLQEYQLDPGAEHAIENASALLEVARTAGVAEAIQWLQAQLLGGLAKVAAAGDVEAGSYLISELLAITAADEQASAHLWIADTLIKHCRGEAGFQWTEDQINAAIDQTSSSGMSVMLHARLIDFLLLTAGEDRIEQAMTRFLQVLQGWEKEGHSFEGVYGNLGRSFLFRERGDRQDNLRKAQAYLERELAIGAKSDHDNLAVTHRLLGITYMKLGDRQAAVHHLEQGISLDPTRSTEAFAGAALDLRELRIGARGVGNQLALEEAIQDLARGLVGAPENTEAWAWVHANLGNLYRERQAGDPADNLRRAYQHTNLALTVFTRKTHENEWAQMQHNLGTIYLADSFHDRADNLEKAIACFKNTLGVHTRENYPQYYGLTSATLGNALMQRILGKRERNYQEALHYLQEAEGVLDPEASKTWWAECMTALGQIHRWLALPDRSQNLWKAAEYMEKARRVYAGLGNKERETQMTSNLTVIYMDLGEFEPPAYQKALEFAEAAVGATNRETDPFQWAIFNRNLAAAIENQAQTTPADHQRALEHLRSALEIFTPDAYLPEYRRSINDLGHLYFNDGLWAEALAAYQASIQAGEALLASAYTEQGKKAQLKETELAYTRSAYCLVRLNRLDEALVMVESSKARLIAEALSLSEVDLADIPAALSGRLHRAQETVRSLEGQMRLATALRTIDTAALGTRLREARRQLDAVVTEMRSANPSFGGKLKTVAEIGEQVPAGGALVAFDVTRFGTLVFTVPAGTRQLQSAHIIEIPDFTTETLDWLLDDQSPHSWIALSRAAGVLKTPQQFREWLGHQDSFMNALWTALMEPVYARLCELGIAPGAPLLLLPQGGLWLLALHAASRPVDGVQRAFGDDYVITYTPSLYARKICHARSADREDEPPALMAVINPGGDLPYAAKEVALISHHFKDPVLLPGKAATLETVRRLAGSTSYLHFSCHGFHDWSDPMLSGLQLAPPDYLLLTEILARFSLNKNRLVTLSACETGLIDLRGAADEFVGLPTGFLAAGASGVITTLWKVDDAASCLLVSAFYQHHLGSQQLPPAEALQAAQQWLRALTLEKVFALKDIDGKAIQQRYRKWFGEIAPDDRLFDHPFFWAGFAYAGG